MGQSAKISLRWCYGEYWPEPKSVNTISKYAVMNIFLHWQLGHDQHKCLLDGCCSLHIAYGIDIFINTVWTCLQSFHPRHFPNALDAAVFSAAAKIVAASQPISPFLRISFNNPIFWYIRISTPIMSHPARKNWPAWGSKRSGQQEVNMKFISIVKSFSFTIAKSFSFSIVKTTNSKINSTRPSETYSASWMIMIIMMMMIIVIMIRDAWVVLVVVAVSQSIPGTWGAMMVVVLQVIIIIIAPSPRHNHFSE